jgi:hypothetical protein
MSLLEPPADTQKKSRAMIFTMTAALLIAVIAVWFWLRFYPEKKPRRILQRRRGRRHAPRLPTLVNPAPATM